MEFALGIVRAVRSLRADYNLTKTKADCRYQVGAGPGRRSSPVPCPLTSDPSLALPPFLPQASCSAVTGARPSWQPRSPATSGH